MRENAFVLIEPFVKGLAPDADLMRSAGYLLQSSNAKPSADGSVSPETVTWPLSGSPTTIVWPSPQFLAGENATVLIGNTTFKAVARPAWTSADVTMYLMTDTATTTALNSAGPWQMASFKEIYVLTNGAQIITNTPYSSGKVIASTTAFKAVANCQDRLWIGGLPSALTGSGSWNTIFSAWRETQPEGHFSHQDMSVATNWAIWGEPGGGVDDVPFFLLFAALGLFGTTVQTKFLEEILTSIEEHKIGLVPLRMPGEVRAIKQLGERAIIYGSNSISVASPTDDGGYQEEHAHDLGLHGRGALAGTDTLHVWVSPEGFLYRWRLGEGIDNLEQKHRLATSNTIMVSHDAAYDDFWIADGAYSYVLSKTGLGGPMDVRPTGVFRDATKGLAGLAQNQTQSSFTVELKSNTFDMGRRGRKQVKVIQNHTEGLTALQNKVDGRINGSDSFSNLGYVPCGPGGISYVHRSAVDFRAYLKGTSTGASRVERMEVRYHVEDKSHERGTKGAVAGEEREG